MCIKHPAQTSPPSSRLSTCHFHQAVSRAMKTQHSLTPSSSPRPADGSSSVSSQHTHLPPPPQLPPSPRHQLSPPLKPFWSLPHSLGWTPRCLIGSTKSCKDNPYLPPWLTFLHSPSYLLTLQPHCLLPQGLCTHHHSFAWNGVTFFISYPTLGLIITFPDPQS